MQTVFKRYEQKYLLTGGQRAFVEQALQAHMRKDAFAETLVCNIYYDTENHLLIRRSMEKPLYKEKLRVRSYGVATEGSEVFVELKKKFNGVVYKRRACMPLSEARLFLQSGALPCPANQILKELHYTLGFYKTLAPSLYLSYRRTAYRGKENPDLRITLDSRILYRNHTLSLSLPPYSTPLLPEGHSVMEVKSPGSLPLWLTRLLSGGQIYKQPFSKYGAAFARLSEGPGLPQAFPQIAN